MFGGVLHVWFHWPDGAVLTNLVAWLIGLVMGAATGRRAWKRHKAAIALLHEHVLQIHTYHGIETKEPPK